MARRRRGNANELTIIYWADIPAQVTGQAGTEKAKALLTDRFQHAIDRAAAVADKTDTGPYVEEWRRVARALSGTDVQAEVDAAAAQLETDYPRERLEALVANGGDEPAATQNAATQQEPADETPADDSGEQQ